MNRHLQAVDQLNDRLNDAHAIGQALDLAGGETPPAWVLVYQSQIEAIQVAAEALESQIRGGEHVQN